MKQLALMDKIYKKAENVLVWLRGPPQGAAGCLEKLPSVLKRVEAAIRDIGFNFKPSARLGLPADNHPVWRVIVDIFGKEWHRRVWTLQEAVLAKRLVVFYGKNIIGWNFLVKLYKAYGSAPLLPSRGNFGKTKESRHEYIRWIQTYRLRYESNKPLDFVHLLSINALRGCGHEEDRVYGLLRLAQDSVRKRTLEVSKMLVPEVYLKSFKVAIEYNPELHLLSLCFERGGTEGLPTWCPDLSRWNGCDQLQLYPVGMRPRGPHDLR
jgi:hypothetical protein